MWPYKGMSVEIAINASKRDKRSTWREIIEEYTDNSDRIDEDD